MNAKRLGGLGSLKDFGRNPAPASPAPAKTSKAQPEVQPAAPPAAPKEQEKLVTVNIKITSTQQEWLAKAARQVRSNNVAPVPPADRVYPQHLIQVAIELLKSADINWEEVSSVEDLKEHLNL